jgi:hypothetical protein
MCRMRCSVSAVRHPGTADSYPSRPPSTVDHPLAHHIVGDSPHDDGACQTRLRPQAEYAPVRVGAAGSGRTSVAPCGTRPERGLPQFYRRHHDATLRGSFCLSSENRWGFAARTQSPDRPVGGHSAKRRHGRDSLGVGRTVPAQISELTLRHADVVNAVVHRRIEVLRGWRAS